MNRTKTLVWKILLISLPFLLIISVYFITDPFKVLRHYRFDNYYNWQPWELNREVCGVENLKERLEKNDVPDSYIFGSSRSFVFRCDVWEHILNDSSRAFHMDAASETLFGVYGKVKYLDRQNIKIKNVMLICDANLLSKVDNIYDITHIKHPDISRESRFSFQTNFIKGYFTDFFFFKHIDFLSSHRIKEYMGTIFAINPGYIRTSAYKNDYYYQAYDSMMNKDSVAYYFSKKDVFGERPAVQEISEAVIKNKETLMLKEMKAIFDKNNTRVKIIISPIYDQKKFNPADLNILTGIFGDHIIYDYSGKNDITKTKFNYYEANHFKPYIAEKIMSEIYAK